MRTTLRGGKARCALFLRQFVEPLVPRMRKRLDELRSTQGAKVIGSITKGQLLGGLDDVPAIPCLATKVIPEQGVRFGELTCQDVMHWSPTRLMLQLLQEGRDADPASVMDFEAALQQEDSLSVTLNELCVALSEVNPRPMDVLGAMILALDCQSAMRSKIDPKNLWIPYAEDAMKIMALMPQVAALVYRNCCGGRIGSLEPSPNLSWHQNFVRMLGFDLESDAGKILSAYLILHTDHSANASTLAAMVTASTGASAYQAVAAGVAALDGPLHGGANALTLQLLQTIVDNIGTSFNEDELTRVIGEWLDSGQKIPGTGHRKLQCVDPRAVALLKLCRDLDCCKSNPLFLALDRSTFMMREVVVRLAGERGKSLGKGFPNVDYVGGTVFSLCGLKPPSIYPVVFAVSRVIGWLVNCLHWHMQGLPIIRPNGLTWDEIAEAGTQ